MTLLLRSVAGSHLYGTSRPDSDLDYYEVHSELFKPGGFHKTQQTIVDGVDVTKVSLSQFIDLCRIGSHQALDAMFSEQVEVDKIEAFRKGYRAGFEIMEPYRRIMVKFTQQGTPRKRKHAVRIAFNLTDIMQTGRFNPTLSPERVEKVLTYAELPDEEFYETLKNLSPVELKFWTQS